MTEALAQAGKCAEYLVLDVAGQLSGDIEGEISGSSADPAGTDPPRPRSAPKAQGPSPPRPDV